MPELPEVETVRRGLEPVLVGQRIAEAVQRRADLRWPLPERFAERLTGRRVERLRRRSKYLIADLDGGESWLVHLGMSGRISVLAPEPQPQPELEPAGAGAQTLGRFAHGGPGSGAHDHVSLLTAAGTWIVYNDARRFGAMDLWPTEALEAHRLLAGLGPEPLGNAFSGAVLAAALAGRQTPIKAALLDQRVVAGLGNIYVCEALNRAGIHPRRMAGTIGRARIERLAAEIRATLTDAIAAGGSSLRDYRRADGELGYFQHSFRVYGREGEPCPCGGKGARVLRIVQSGRSSFYCSRCQR
ncbi:bifunctional DNA-formamidopyrimidine glycosylase/DNA-(apurinic or apyrimidinic site) lyase [Paralimibaculum aggregatum]|uniref:Formamidopyrimidine-DNA glycosylase n=1 Tax=Paralimibaculum aggregatum TaxID=3036245 RepID=A0ABQ6LIF2_9RHOB|nr:bifunctional DNA-formamidopyrimidine glycosylase/DNA-(apurinic or apyrimidinic site) lyase [Limibaculum sp. NKW23]GMG82211.1 bifunctional DNA-formamidopyrimidine glycosylase/DNA-(apurinic or apyrimidinic site) lyase [Limibaculum sp. NKW23]